MFKIIKGSDKRYPSKTLNLDNGSGIALNVEGSDLATAPKNILYGGLQTGRDGQSRKNTTRDNAQFTITYHLQGGQGPARLVQLHRDLSQLDLDVREYEENGIGEPVWLAFRASDGLDLPEPVFGQFSLFVRILHINVTGWAANITNPNVRAGSWGTAATLTVAPYAEGLEQACGLASGAVKVDPDYGLIVLDGDTDINNFTNPSFGHSTYDNDWTISASGGGTATKTQITAPGLTRSYNSACLVSHSGSSGAARLTQTVNPNNTSAFFTSCYCRKPDGSEVTASDLKIVNKGADVSTEFVAVGDGWYLAFQSGITPSSSAYGVEIQTGKSVIVDDLTCANHDGVFDNFTPFSFLNGDHLGCSWDGTPHDSKTDATDGVVEWSMTREFHGEWTVTGWATVVGDPHANSSGEAAIWSYKEDASNYVSFGYTSYSGSNRVLILEKNGSSDTAAIPLARYDSFHFAIVQDSSGLSVYINGAAIAISLADTEGFSGSGTLSIGHDNQMTTRRCNWAIDAPRIWGKALSSTEINRMHSNEVAVKTNGDLLGIPPFVWTHDGGGSFENDMDTANNDFNWAVIGGVSGDLPAETKLQYATLNHDNGFFHVAMKAVEYARHIQPEGLFWFNSFTTGTTSGGEYFIAEITHQDRDLWNGQNDLIAVVSDPAASAVMGGGARTFTPYVEYPERRYAWDPVSGESPTSIEEEFIVEMSFAVGFAKGVQKIQSIGIYVLVEAALPANWNISDLIVMPRPHCRISGDAFDNYAIGGTLVIRDHEAYVTDSSNDYLPANHEGDKIECLPGRYNWLFHFDYEYAAPGGAGSVYAPAASFTLTPTITPRFNLLGGPIA